MDFSVPFKFQVSKGSAISHCLLVMDLHIESAIACTSVYIHYMTVH